MYKALFLISVVSIIIGCDEKKDESIDFLAPQPIGIQNKPSFSKHYQGVYINPGDSSVLRIDKSSIISSTTTPCIFSINDIDSSIKVDRSNIKALEAALSGFYTFKIIKLKNDSIYGYISIVDTIFSISENNTCRFYKGSYFLNYTYDNITWKVKRLDLNKNKLTIGMIIPTDSLFNIYPVQNKHITKNKYIFKSDSTAIDSIIVLNYTIVPTKKELKKLAEKGFFSEWNVWIKQ